MRRHLAEPYIWPIDVISDTPLESYTTTMAQTICKVHLVRHAEGVHTLFPDGRTIPDAQLSQRGYDSAEDLGRRLISEHSNTICTIISSPLRRTIQTSLAAFHRALHTKYYPTNSGRGAQDGVRLVLDANLQEIDDLPCNTGSPREELIDQFPELHDEISLLHPRWYVKSGPESPLPPRARRKEQILKRLEQAFQESSDSKKTDVVVVAHGGVIEMLVRGADIDIAQWKTFDLVRTSSGQLELE